MRLANLAIVWALIGGANCWGADKLWGLVGDQILVERGLHYLESRELHAVRYSVTDRLMIAFAVRTARLRLSWYNVRGYQVPQCSRSRPITQGVILARQLASSSELLRTTSLEGVAYAIRVLAFGYQQEYDGALGVLTEELLERQNRNGSWGPRGGDSYHTYLAIRAIFESSLQCSSEIDYAKAVESACTWVLSRQNPDGSWPAAPFWQRSLVPGLLARPRGDGSAQSPSRRRRALTKTAGLKAGQQNDQMCETAASLGTLFVGGYVLRLCRQLRIGRHIPRKAPKLGSARLKKKHPPPPLTKKYTYMSYWAPVKRGREWLLKQPLKVSGLPEWAPFFFAVYGSVEDFEEIRTGDYRIDWDSDRDKASRRWLWLMQRPDGSVRSQTLGATRATVYALELLKRRWSFHDPERQRFVR